MAKMAKRTYHKPKGFSALAKKLPTLTQLGGIAWIVGAFRPRMLGATGRTLGLEVFNDPQTQPPFDQAVAVVRNLAATLSTNHVAQLLVGVGIAGRLTGIRTLGGIRLW